MTSGAYLNTLRESASRDDLLREIERQVEEKAALRAAHDARVTDLLAANNREVERRRQAEAASLVGFLSDLMAWQAATFGTRQTVRGVLDHVVKEIEAEIRPNPTDCKEWLGLMNLAVSALRLQGIGPAGAALFWRRLLTELKARTWPDWRTADPDKAIEHDRSGDRPAGLADPFTFLYLNYKGEIGERRAIPMSVRFGSTEWHQEPQWLLRAFDLDKQAEREFAMKDMLVAPIPFRCGCGWRGDYSALQLTPEEAVCPSCRRSRSLIGDEAPEAAQPAGRVEPDLIGRAYDKLKQAPGEDPYDGATPPTAGAVDDGEE